MGMMEIAYGRAALGRPQGRRGYPACYVPAATPTSPPPTMSIRRERGVNVVWRAPKTRANNLDNRLNIGKDRANIPIYPGAASRLRSASSSLGPLCFRARGGRSRRSRSPRGRRRRRPPCRPRTRPAGAPTTSCPPRRRRDRSRAGSTGSPDAMTPSTTAAMDAPAEGMDSLRVRPGSAACSREVAVARPWFALRIRWSAPTNSAMTLGTSQNARSSSFDGPVTSLGPLSAGVLVSTSFDIAPICATHVLS